MTRLLFCLLILASSAQAAVTPLADYHKAVVRVGQQESANVSAAGTGTVICRENGGLVISVAHIFETGGPCWVDYGDGRRYPARLIGVDRTLDIAALITAAPPEDIPCLPLGESSEYAPGGSEVEFIGFGGGDFRHFTANCMGYGERGGSGSQILLNFKSISGDSGGPVLYNGKVVAVQWGWSDDGSGAKSQGTYCGRIQEFLTQYRVPVCQSCEPVVRPISRPPLAPVPPKPVTPATPAKPCNCDNAVLIARIEKLEKELLVVGARPMLPGPVGPAGPAGPKGDTGAPAQINPAELAKQLPPITFEIWNDGKLIPGGTRIVPLGGTLPLERYLIGGK